MVGEVHPTDDLEEDARSKKSMCFLKLGLVNPTRIKKVLRRDEQGADRVDLLVF